MLDIRSLIKIYEPTRAQKWGRVRAVDNVTVHVEEGDFFTLLGPSGCGKTTLLRSVSGLEEPDSGIIVVNGTTLFSSAERVNVSANRRGLGMVFQSYAIWPHMNVFDNAAYPLASMRPRRSRDQIKQIVQRTLAVCELEHLQSRMATDLSGGQQQRLALARALVQEPPVLLLDEPLSNLDAKLRVSMRAELTRLQREMGLTILYVTHDQTEALALSTSVAVLRDGRVEQVGTPREVYETPKTRFVADFVGTSNFVPGTVIESTGDGVGTVDTGAGRIRAHRTGEAVATGSKAEVAVRPERLVVRQVADPAKTGGLAGRGNHLVGDVASATYFGDAVEYQIELAGGVQVTANCHPSVEIAPRSQVVVEFPEDACSIVTAE